MSQFVIPATLSASQNYKHAFAIALNPESTNTFIPKITIY